MTRVSGITRMAGITRVTEMTRMSMIEHLRKLNLLPLKYRREFNDLVFTICKVPMGLILLS